MKPRAAVALGLATSAAWALAGCGGGSALLHPVHPLPQGDVSLGAGVTGQLAYTQARDQIDEARVTTSDPARLVAPDARQRFAEGAVAHTLLAPGVAPWVSMRVGLGEQSDAGLTYGGRAVRGDARRAFVFDAFALSAGGGFSAVLARPSSTGSPSDGAGVATGARAGEIPGLDAGAVSGWALDLPLLAGWRSQGNLVQVWAGPRAGYERLAGNFVFSIDPDPAVQQRADVKLARWWAGGVLGFAVGVRPIQVALELDVAYQQLSGDLALEEANGSTSALSTTGTGLSVAPSGALITRF